MGRGRIPMELIQKEKARKTTFHKRKNGLIKKVYEFSTLCGVDVGAIIFAPKFLDEPEIWPHDPTAVKRIIQKYQSTTSDRRPKVYDVQEYFSDRMKKIEGEISKVQKEKMKIIYPTWDDSYNTLGQEELRLFVSILDAKLDACNQRMNMLKCDSKGKAIAESNKAETLIAPNMASSHLNFMQNMSGAQLFPLLNSDNNQLAFYPGQLSQSSQSSMFHNFGQNCNQLMGKNAKVDWANQVGAGVCDPNKVGVLNGSEKHQNSSSFCYNGNMRTVQPYNVALQTLPSQLQYDSAFQTLPDPPPDFDSFYNLNMFQPQFFDYLHGKK